MSQHDEKPILQTRQIQATHNWEENVPQEYSTNNNTENSNNVGHNENLSQSLPSHWLQTTTASKDLTSDWSKHIDNLEYDWPSSNHDTTFDWSASTQNLDSDWSHPSQSLDYDWSHNNRDVDTRSTSETVTKRNEGSSEKDWISSKLNHQFFKGQNDLKLTSWPLVNPNDGSYSITIAL